MKSHVEPGSALSLEAPPPRSAPSIGKRLAQLPGAFYLLVALVAVLSVGSPYFLTAANLTNVLLQASVVLIIALGMTMVILTEGIDLSLGPVLGLSAVVMSLLLVAGYSFTVALPAAILVAMLFGLFNGVLVSYFNLPPFVVTLSSFGMATSFALALTDGNSVVGLPNGIRFFNEGSFLGIPVPIWATASLFLLTWIVLYRTPFGRYVFAIGGNRQALMRSGVNVQACQTLVYVYAAALTGVASFIMTARANAAHPTIGVGLEFDAIAAAVLGGASFTGGRGNPIGTVVGAIAVATLRNGLNLMGVQTEWQAAAVGLVIILGVGIDSLRGYNR
jgi:ribose transport system permease protein